MTTQEIASMIAGIGLPYAYDHFDEDNTPGHPPFICFTYPSSDNFSADNKVYQRIRRLNIELYTDEKDLDLESAVENALDAAELFYDCNETYLDSEKMYMVRWETEVLLEESDSDDSGET